MPAKADGSTEYALCSVCSYWGGRFGSRLEAGHHDGCPVRELSSMRERVAMLEEALDRLGISPDPVVCDCCDRRFLPTRDDAHRCPACSLSCHFDEERWVQGVNCPSRKGAV